MQQKKVEVENANNHQNSIAAFALAGHLLAARDESTAILAAMRAGHEMLSAEGCAFVPFNEWKQSIPVLKYGEAELSTKFGLAGAIVCSSYTACLS